MIVIFKEITFLYITENDPSLNSSLSIISNQLLLMFRDNHLDSFRSIFTRKGGIDGFPSSEISIRGNKEVAVNRSRLTLHPTKLLDS